MSTGSSFVGHTEGLRFWTILVYLGFVLPPTWFNRASATLSEFKVASHHCCTTRGPRACSTRHQQGEYRGVTSTNVQQSTLLPSSASAAQTHSMGVPRCIHSTTGYFATNANTISIASQRPVSKLYISGHTTTWAMATLRHTCATTRISR